VEDGGVNVRLSLLTMNRDREASHELIVEAIHGEGLRSGSPGSNVKVTGLGSIVEGSSVARGNLKGTDSNGNKVSRAIAEAQDKTKAESINEVLELSAITVSNSENGNDVAGHEGITDLLHRAGARGEGLSRGDKEKLAGSVTPANSITTSRSDFSDRSKDIVIGRAVNGSLLGMVGDPIEVARVGENLDDAVMETIAWEVAVHGNTDVGVGGENLEQVSELSEERILVLRVKLVESSKIPLNLIRSTHSNIDLKREVSVGSRVLSEEDIGKARRDWEGILLSQAARSVSVKGVTPVLASRVVDWARASTREATIGLNAPAAEGISSAGVARGVLEASVVADTASDGERSARVLENSHLTIRLVLAEGRAEEELSNVSSTRSGQSDLSRSARKIQHRETAATIERPVESHRVAIANCSSAAFSPWDKGGRAISSKSEGVASAIRITVAVVVHDHHVELREVGSKVVGLSEVDESRVLNLASAHEVSNLSLSAEGSSVQAGIASIDNLNSLKRNSTSNGVSSKAAILSLSRAVRTNPASIASTRATRSAAAIARASVRAAISLALRVKDVARDSSSFDTLSSAVRLFNNEITSDASIRHALHVEGRASSVRSRAESIELVPEREVVGLNGKAWVNDDLRGRRGRPHRRRGRRRGRRGRSIATSTTIIHTRRRITARGHRARENWGLSKDTLLS